MHTWNLYTDIGMQQISNLSFGLDLETFLISGLDGETLYQIYIEEFIGWCSWNILQTV